jgi:hypothetical protein
VASFSYQFFRWTQEYVSCPSCGRTLFDLQDVSAEIREKTDHLPGVSVCHLRSFYFKVIWRICVSAHYNLVIYP